MILTLRVDLDYVPWDTPDAKDFGHGEPAVVIRMLESARKLGFKFHFFASNRTIRAFPAMATAILGEGHPLDWLCKHPESMEKRWDDAQRLFDSLGEQIMGMAIRGAWPENEASEIPDSIQFVSTIGGDAPPCKNWFPVVSRTAREAMRAGITTKVWADGIADEIRSSASRNRPFILAVRPQVLAKFDPQLGHIKRLIQLGEAVGLRVGTLRERLGENK